jgi:hypothetical protein
MKEASLNAFDSSSPVSLLCHLPASCLFASQIWHLAACFQGVDALVTRTLVCFDFLYTHALQRFQDAPAR